jgi:hypothetical protein
VRLDLTARGAAMLSLRRSRKYPPRWYLHTSTRAVGSRFQLHLAVAMTSALVSCLSAASYSFVSRIASFPTGLRL